jgi:hypothetical protein
VPLAVLERVLALYRKKYFDLNVRHFHEKLRAEHRIELRYSWVNGRPRRSPAGHAAAYRRQ